MICPPFLPLMKSILLLAAAALFSASCSTSSFIKQVPVSASCCAQEAGTCNPKGVCTACSDCSSCKHCSRGGGKCSVCK